MKINKIAYHILNVLLFAAIIIGQYGWIEAKSVISIFVLPAFIISATLTYNAKDKKSEKNE